MTKISNHLSCSRYQSCLVYFTLMMLDYSKNVYLGVFEGADYVSSVKFVNFKIADPI